MTSEGKKVRAEFKKAFDTKDIKKIEQIGKRKKIEDMIPLDIITRYLNKAAKNDELYLCYAILDGIGEKYDEMDLYFSMIDTNNTKLMEELLDKFPYDVCCTLLNYAVDRGRLTIAEMIYPFADERYDGEIDGMGSYYDLKEFIESKLYDLKSYSKFKAFVDDNWFVVDEDDMSEDGFILAVVSNRSDLVKKILKSREINISVRDNFAITYACDYGYSDIVKMLLKYDKSCFYTDNEYAYKLAVRRNYVDMVKMMDEVMVLGN